MRRRATQAGMAYLLMLFALVTVGLLLAAMGTHWKQAAQREREAELLYIGRQFAQALASYAALTPQGQPTAPARIEELLADPRFPFPVRHLREHYRDPFSGRREWGTTRLDGRIRAFHSLAETKPLREGELPAWISVQQAQDHARYTDWHFVAAARTP